MNETSVTQTNKLIFKRFSESLIETGHFEPMDYLWGGLLIGVLLIGFFYVIWMYLRDSRTVGFWSAPLALLRCLVYVVLAGVFILPGCRDYEEVRRESKVVVLFDVSDSMDTRDDVPDERTKWKDLQTRQDKVLTFLGQTDKSDPRIDFFGRLTRKNPVTAYRFGSKLDESWMYQFTKDGGVWVRKQYEEAAEREGKAPARQVLPREFLTNWLKGGVEVNEDVDWDSAHRKDWLKLYDAQAKANKARRDEGFFSGTNLGATRTAFDHEISNLVQGIVVFTDGRMNQGSDFYDDLAKAAEKRKVPIFVVGVGSVRPQVRIAIASIRANDQIRPDDKFRVMVDVIGEGLGDQEFDLTLDVSAVKKTDDAKKVEEPEEIAIVEQVDPKKPDKPRIRHVLAEAGKKISLKPETPPKFDRRNTPPRAEVEFALDAAKLAAAAGVKLEDGKRWEFEDLKGGALRFRARVPKNRMEIFEKDEHVSDPQDVRVVKKELHVLLMASAAMRDYQFVRTLLVREMDMKRVDLCIYLQLPPGRTERRPGIVQDVDPSRLLSKFPDAYDTVPADGDPTARFYDLASYDVIIAFDPDWNQLDPIQIQNVQKWVDKGGGLIVVGGPINTVQLASPGANKPTEKFAPLVDIYPVVLDDVRLRDGERKTDDPFPLQFDAGANDEMEFLRLSEEGDKDFNPGGFRMDWEVFYGKEGAKKDAKVQRGFYNFYPVEKAKTGALVVARFYDPDPRARLKDLTFQPYLVISNPDSGRRVVWIGSAETWRLRAFRENYHERFWIKLARFAGANNNRKVSRRIVPLFNNPVFSVNQAIAMDFKIENKGGEPLGKPKKDDQRPKVELTPPPGVKIEDKDAKHFANFKSDGLWTVQFQARSAGKYGLKLTVPETGDSLEAKFDVKDANPETDDVRPDYDAMMKLASEADPVLGRMNAGEAQVLRQLLEQKQRSQRGDKTADADEKLKLVFDLRSAEQIPNCMLTDSSKQTNRGGGLDLWDWGFTLRRDGPAFAVFLWVGVLAGLLAALCLVLALTVPSIASEAYAGLMVMGLIFLMALGAVGMQFLADVNHWDPVKVSVVLLTVVGLLSLEWLLRKLLRLA